MQYEEGEMQAIPFEGLAAAVVRLTAANRRMLGSVLPTLSCTRLIIILPEGR
jgi:hypothetical protein